MNFQALYEGNTPLHILCKNMGVHKNWAPLKWMLENQEKLKIDVSAKNNAHRTPFEELGFYDRNKADELVREIFKIKLKSNIENLNPKISPKLRDNLKTFGIEYCVCKRCQRIFHKESEVRLHFIIEHKDDPKSTDYYHEGLRHTEQSSVFRELL